MIKDTTKQRIEAMTTDEMDFEINLGHRSRFQRDNFAYLKTCYESKLREATKQHPPQFPSNNSAKHIKEWHENPIGKVGIGIVIALLAYAAISLI